LGFSGEPLNVRSSNVGAMGGGYGVCIIKKNNRFIGDKKKLSKFN
jgi:hypothetical protein